MEDDELQDALAAAAQRLDPPPEASVLAARSALAYRDLDARLAELVADSAETELAGVRSTTAVRLVTFQAEVLAVDLEVAPTGNTCTCTGQIVPARQGHVLVRHGGGEVEVEADEIGRFRAEHVARGPVSLRITVGEGADRHVVDTSWLTI